MNYNFYYKWYLKDGYPQSIDKKVKPNNYKVFGTFINAGGSTMGYKLAGYHHLGGIEIDERTAQCYKHNHNPLYLYVQDIREFNNRQDLPNELFDLDILDGSPPCTTFSGIALNTNTLGIEKVFQEGRHKQTLDDLVFEYAHTINKLKPKVFIFENVTGILFDMHKPYLCKFLEILKDYRSQIFLLNSALMGLPQTRRRCFIIGLQNKYDYLPKINLDFKGKIITFKEVSDNTDTECNLSYRANIYWSKAKQGDSVGKFKTIKKLMMDKPSFTISASSKHYHPIYPRYMNKQEICLCSSFPLDYEFIEHNFVFYMGMCVPPIMIANIAYAIKLQWLDNINEHTNTINF